MRRRCCASIAPASAPMPCSTRTRRKLSSAGWARSSPGPGRRTVANRTEPSGAARGRYTLAARNHQLDEMNKTELVQALAAATETSQAAASRALDALVRITSEELSKGGEVAIPGFGTFK